MQSLRRNVRSNQLSSTKTTLKTTQNKGKLTIDGIGGNDVNLVIPTLNESLDIYLPTTSGTITMKGESLSSDGTGRVTVDDALLMANGDGIVSETLAIDKTLTLNDAYYQKIKATSTITMRLPPIAVDNKGLSFVVNNVSENGKHIKVKRIDNEIVKIVEQDNTSWFMCNGSDWYEAAASGGGSGGAVASGLINEIQFNNGADGLMASKNLTFDGYTLNVGSYTGSTDTDTGAIVVKGGVGVQENIEVGGNLNIGGTISVNSEIIRLGKNSGGENMGLSSIAIGDGSGGNQIAYAIAMGKNAGLSQSVMAVAIGYGAGVRQDANAIAIGNSAGGNLAGLQGEGAIAIGGGAGQTNQGIYSVALGGDAGKTTQGIRGVAIGNLAGQTTQGDNAISIGYEAGKTTQGLNSVALGNLAGKTTQGVNAISIGNLAGQSSQGSSGIALGYGSGQTTQGANAISIGYTAGSTTQGIDSIALGNLAGQSSQGAGAIAIGGGAGRLNQVANAIAIGKNAGGGDTQDSASIILNTSGFDLGDGGNAGLFVNPVRYAPFTTGRLMMYDSVTKEISAQNKLIVNSNNTFTINSTEPSTSSSTGALLVKGGIGIEGGIYAHGSITTLGTVTSNILRLKSNLREVSTNLKLPSSQISDYTLTLPDQSGVIATMANLSAAANAKGSSGDIQYNDGNNTITASAALNYDGTKLKLNNVTPSLGTNTGALVVQGGMGIYGDSNMGGTLTLYSTEPSINTTTGALLVKGGVGIEENLNIGGTLTIASKKVASIVLESDSDNFVAAGTEHPHIFMRTAGGSVEHKIYLDSGKNLTAQTKGNFGFKIRTNDTDRVNVTGSGISQFLLTTDSSDPVTGALVVSGGVGIAKKLHIGDETDSSSTVTGALVVSGGVGIKKNIYLGGNIIGKQQNRGYLSIDSISTDSISVRNNVTILGNLNVTGTQSALNSEILTVANPVFILGGSVTSGVGSHTLAVTVVGGKFVINGVSQKSLVMKRGDTYTFDVSAASNGTHLFAFSTNANNTPSAPYTTGVTVSGTAGSGGATVEIVVDAGAADDLYYYCTAHSNMGSNIEVVDQGAIVSKAELNQDRGLEYNYNDGEEKIGFFGLDRNLTSFTFIPDAVGTGNIYSGSRGGFIGNTFIGDTSMSAPSISDNVATLNLGKLTEVKEITFNNGQNNTISISNTADGVAGKELVILSGETTEEGGSNNIVGGDLILGTGRSTGSGLGGDILFTTSTAGGANDFYNSRSTKMIIKSDGKIGSGISTPQKQVHINVDNNGANIPLVVSNQNTTDSGGNAVGIGFVNESTPSYFKHAIFAERLDSNARGSLHLSVNSTADGSNVTLSDARITIDKLGNVGIGTRTPTKQLEVAGDTLIKNTTFSTSTNTGTLVVNGGVGIEQNIHLGGTMTIHSTELSTSTATGALKVLGGVGIQENLNVGGNLGISGGLLINSITSNLILASNGDSLNPQILVKPSHSNILGQDVYMKLEGARNGSTANIPSAVILANFDSDGPGSRALGMVGCRVTDVTNNVGDLIFGTYGTTFSNPVDRMKIDHLGTVTINNTLPSVGTQTGALVVKGGVGIEENINIGGEINVGNSTSVVGDGGRIGSMKIGTWGGNSGFGVITHNDLKGSNNSYALLQNNTGSTYLNSAAGRNLHLRVNNSDIVVFQPHGYMGIGTNSPTEMLHLTGNVLVETFTYSSSTNTGALVLKGGAGIQQNMHLGGTMTIHSTELSTSTATGALKILGGVGIQEKLHVGGTISAVKGIQIINDSGDVTTIKPAGVGDRVATFPNKNGIVAMMGDINALASGASGQIQFHDGSTGFDATSDLTYDGQKLTIGDVTTSNSTETGALVVRGGVGIHENLNVGGSITTTGTITAKNLILQNSNVTPTANTLLKIDESQGSNSTITFPAGNVTLATKADVAASATVAGASGQIQYHDGGTSLAATSDLTYDGTKLTIGDVTTSTSTQTGALVVRGGVGIHERLHVGSTITGSSLYLSQIVSAEPMAVFSAHTGALKNSSIKVTSTAKSYIELVNSMILDGGDGAWQNLITNYGGTKYYVDVAGNDSNNGLTEGTAWATPVKAFDDATNDSMIIIKPGTYIYNRVGNIGGGLYSNAIVWDQDTGGNAKLYRIICYPGEVILRGTATNTSSPRDFHAGSLLHTESYIYGAIIERDNGGRTNEYANSFFGNNGGYADVKGNYYNCVFKEINANGKYTGSYGNTPGGNQSIINNCVFMGTDWGSGNYSGNSAFLTYNNVVSNDSSFNTGSHVAIENNVVKGATIAADYTVDDTSVGVWSGSITWAIDTQHGWGIGTDSTTNLNIHWKKNGTMDETQKAMVISKKGWVGIGPTEPTEKLHVSGRLLVDTTTNSTYYDTGALVVKGGVGIEQDLFVGGSISSLGTITTSYLTSDKMNIHIDQTGNSAEPIATFSASSNDHATSSITNSSIKIRSGGRSYVELDNIYSKDGIPPSYMNLVNAYGGTKYHIKMAADGGDDANNGLSEATAWRTPRKAFNECPSDVMIIIYEGTYTSSFPNTPVYGVGGGYLQKLVSHPSPHPYMNAIVHDTNQTNGTEKIFRIVCEDSKVVLRGNCAGPTYPNALRAGALRHPSSYLYGAIIERDGGARSSTHNQAMFGYHGGYNPMKGTYNNCVFKDISSSGKYSLIYNRYGINYYDGDGHNELHRQGSAITINNCLFTGLPGTEYIESMLNSPDATITDCTLNNVASTEYDFNTPEWSIANFGAPGHIQHIATENNVIRPVTISGHYELTGTTTIGVYSGSNPWPSMTAHGWGIGTDSTTNLNIHWKPTNTMVETTKAMVISKNAWVAIGPTEPTQKLHVSGNVLIDTTTGSYDKDTGALIVQGGVGIEENLNVGGSITTSGTITGKNLILQNSNVTPTAHTLLKIDESQSSDSTITFPAGNVTLATLADISGAGSAVASGASGQIQYHDGGTNLAATSDLTYDGTKLTIGDVTTSTSTETGALVVRGGTGIHENLNVGGSITTTGTITSNVIRIKGGLNSVKTNIKLHSAQATDYTLTLPNKSGEVACLSDIIKDTYLIPLAYSGSSVRQSDQALTNENISTGVDPIHWQTPTTQNITYSSGTFTFKESGYYRVSCRIAATVATAGGERFIGLHAMLNNVEIKFSGQEIHQVDSTTTWCHCYMNFVSLFNKDDVLKFKATQQNIAPTASLIHQANHGGELIISKLLASECYAFSNAHVNSGDLSNTNEACTNLNPVKWSTPITQNMSYSNGLFVVEQTGNYDISVIMNIIADLSGDWKYIMGIIIVNIAGNPGNTRLAHHQFMSLAQQDTGDSYTSIKMRKIIKLDAGDEFKLVLSHADLTPVVKIDHTNPGSIIIKKFNQDIKSYPTSLYNISLNSFAHSNGAINNSTLDYTNQELPIGGSINPVYWDTPQLQNISYSNGIFTINDTGTYQISANLAFYISDPGSECFVGFDLYVNNTFTKFTGQEITRYDSAQTHSHSILNMCLTLYAGNTIKFVARSGNTGPAPKMYATSGYGGGLIIQKLLTSVRSSTDNDSNIIIPLTNFGHPTAAGSNTEIQYNNNGTISSSADLTFDGLKLNIASTTPSTTTTTGALVVNGGVGIEENLHVGGSINKDELQITRDGSAITMLASVAHSLQMNAINVVNIGSSGGFGGAEAINLNKLDALGNLTSTIAQFSLRANGGIQMKDFVQCLDSEPSTGTATGSLVVKGGVGIEENLHLGGSITTTGLTLGDDDTVFTNIKLHSAQATDYTLTLPNKPGSFALENNYKLPYAYSTASTQSNGSQADEALTNTLAPIHWLSPSTYNIDYSAGVMTVKEAGTYRVTCRFSVASNGGDLRFLMLKLMKNGVEAKLGAQFIKHRDATSVSVTFSYIDTVQTFVVGDELQFNFYRAGSTGNYIARHVAELGGEFTIQKMDLGDSYAYSSAHTSTSGTFINQNNPINEIYWNSPQLLHFSYSNGIFTAHRPGNYEISVTVNIAQDTSQSGEEAYVGVELIVNSTTIQFQKNGIERLDNASTHTNIKIRKTVVLAQGDTIKFKLTSSLGNPLVQLYSPSATAAGDVIINRLRDEVKSYHLYPFTKILNSYAYSNGTQNSSDGSTANENLPVALIHWQTPTLQYISYSNGVFTINETGLYEINANTLFSLDIDGSESYVALELWINGSRVKQIAKELTRYDTAETFSHCIISIIQSLTAGSTIFFKAVADNGAPQTVLKNIINESGGLVIKKMLTEIQGTDNDNPYRIYGFAGGKTGAVQYNDNSGTITGTDSLIYDASSGFTAQNTITGDILRVNNRTIGNGNTIFKMIDSQTTDNTITLSDKSGINALIPDIPLIHSIPHAYSSNSINSSNGLTTNENITSSAITLHWNIDSSAEIDYSNGEFTFKEAGLYRINASGNALHTAAGGERFVSLEVYINNVLAKWVGQEIEKVEAPGGYAQVYLDFLYQMNVGDVLKFKMDQAEGTPIVLMLHAAGYSGSCSINKILKTDDYIYSHGHINTNGSTDDESAADINPVYWNITANNNITYGNNGLFTISRTGYYEIVACVTFKIDVNDSERYVSTYVYVNADLKDWTGQKFKRQDTSSGENSYTHVKSHLVVLLQAGDIVKFRSKRGASSTIYVNHPFPGYMWIKRLDLNVKGYPYNDFNHLNLNSYIYSHGTVHSTLLDGTDEVIPGTATGIKPMHWQTPLLNNNFTYSAGVYTINDAGTYRIIAKANFIIEVAGDFSQVIFNLWVNDVFKQTAITGLTYYDSADSYQNNIIDIVLTFNAGDTFYFSCANEDQTPSMKLLMENHFAGGLFVRKYLTNVRGVNNHLNNMIIPWKNVGDIASGQEGYIQYNNGSGTITSSSNLVYDQANNSFIVTTGTITGERLRVNRNGKQVLIQSVNDQTSDHTITLPDKSGMIACLADISAGSASAAGTTGQIQYHNGAGDLAATSDLTYDGTKLFIGDVTTSTSTQTGALVVRGGTGIHENLNVGGSITTSGLTSGNARLAAWAGGATHAAFSHTDFKDEHYSYSLLQLSTGATYLNSKEGQEICLRVGNQNMICCHPHGAAGNIAIGLGSVGQIMPTERLHIGGGNVLIDTYTGSTSTNTGALVVNGGVGIQDSIFIGGTISANTNIQSENSLDFWIKQGAGHYTHNVRFEQDGDIHASGDFVGFSTTVSDIKLKKDVKPLEKSLEKIKNLQGVSYTWTQGGRKGQKDIGFIAQEVEKIIPDIVYKKSLPLIDGDIYKTVDYEKMTALLVEAVKEQQKQINELKKELEIIKKESSK